MTDILSGPEASQTQPSETQAPSSGFADPLVDPLSDSGDDAVQMDDSSLFNNTGGTVAA